VLREKAERGDGLEPRIGPCTSRGCCCSVYVDATSAIDSPFDSQLLHRPHLLQSPAQPDPTCITVLPSIALSARPQQDTHRPTQLLIAADPRSIHLTTFTK
jgi:hypothetical protein